MEIRYSKIFPIDAEAPEIVVGLVKIHPEIEYIKLQEYSPHTLGVTQILQQESDVPVQTLIRHHPDAGEYMILLRHGEVTINKLWDLVASSTKRDKALVLCSRIETQQDETFHFPMLDFECSVSAENLRKIMSFVETIQGGGVILESGRSYHYYGFNLLSYSQWLKFMATALLFTGFTDSRHIAHRILSSEARLRIAKIEGSGRYLMTPKVVALVYP